MPDPLRFVGRAVVYDGNDGYRMRLRTRDGSTLYAIRDVKGPTGLIELADDPAVVRLRHRYLNRPVWGYGGLSIRGVGAARGSATITGIYRKYDYAAQVNLGGVSGNDRPIDFTALNPLIVTFEVPDWRPTIPPIPAAMLPPGLDVAAMNAELNEATPYAILSDEWDFERTYSLVPVTRAHPEWSARTLDYIAHGKVEMGMTKDMIAWMFGFPSAYGTVDEVRKLDTWFYDQAVPFESTVYFRNGAVVKYDPPGNLP